MDKIEDLFSETLELIEQYKMEVPTPRGAWPLSICERICQLREMKVSAQEILSRTGIPKPTLYAWEKKKRKREDKFIPIRVLPNAQPKPIESTQGGEKKLSSLTVTVRLPQGICIEGLTQQSMIQMIKELCS